MLLEIFHVLVIISLLVYIRKLHRSIAELEIKYLDLKSQHLELERSFLSLSLKLKNILL